MRYREFQIANDNVGYDFKRLVKRCRSEHRSFEFQPAVTRERFSSVTITSAPFDEFIPAVTKSPIYPILIDL